MNKNDFLFYVGIGVIILGIVIDITFLRYVLIIVGFWISVHFYEIPSEIVQKPLNSSIN